MHIPACGPEPRRPPRDKRELGRFARGAALSLDRLLWPDYRTVDGVW